MGWVDPWVRLGRDFSVFWWVGLGPLYARLRRKSKQLSLCDGAFMLACWAAAEDISLKSSF